MSRTVTPTFRRFEPERDPFRLVTTTCWQEGCGTRFEVPYVDAAAGRTYCPDHSVMRAEYLQPRA